MLLLLGDWGGPLYSLDHLVRLNPHAHALSNGHPSMVSCHLDVGLYRTRSDQCASEVSLAASVDSGMTPPEEVGYSRYQDLLPRRSPT